MRTLTAEELLQLRRGGKSVRLIHLGSIPSFGSAHIPGATPLEAEGEPARFVANLLRHASGRELVVLYEGGPRTAEGDTEELVRLAESALRLQWPQGEMALLAGGIDQWRSEGYPIEKDSPPPDAQGPEAPPAGVPGR
jgi:rhodanese-related sulfurtransferase